MCSYKDQGMINKVRYVQCSIYCTGPDQSACMWHANEVCLRVLHSDNLGHLFAQNGNNLGHPEMLIIYATKWIRDRIKNMQK